MEITLLARGPRVIRVMVDNIFVLDLWFNDEKGPAKVVGSPFSSTTGKMGAWHTDAMFKVSFILCAIEEIFRASPQSRAFFFGASYLDPMNFMEFFRDFKGHELRVLAFSELYTRTHLYVLTPQTKIIFETERS